MKFIVTVVRAERGLPLTIETKQVEVAVQSAADLTVSEFVAAANEL